MQVEKSGLIVGGYRSLHCTSCNFGDKEDQKEGTRQFDLSSFQKDLQCEYSPFPLEVVFVQGFLAAKPGFVLNLAGGGHNIQIIQGAAPKDGQCDES